MTTMTTTNSVVGVVGVVGLERNTTDKFYTNDSIAKLCTDKINELNKNDIIIEPSAGSGSFIKYIKKLSKNYEFYDILPEHPEIIQQDFLNLNITRFENKIVHIIGNPPFGRQSSIAIKFIKICCLFAKSISFILPKSFKKKSMNKHFNEFFHLVCEMDLSPNSFNINSTLHNVPCIFQVWTKRDYPRHIEDKEEPIGFIFVKKNEGPDISFRRVGFYAGSISKSIEDKSEQSHYFIKFVGPELINYYDKFNSIIYEENNTVGPKSISKQELVVEFNKLIRNL